MRPGDSLPSVLCPAAAKVVTRSHTVGYGGLLGGGETGLGGWGVKGREVADRANTVTLPTV